MPKKSVTALGQQQRSQDGSGRQTNLPMSILPSTRGEVNCELQSLRERSGCKSIEMVDVVKGIYPKYDKYIHSKCENGREYGITLRPDAMDALVQRFAPEIQAKPRKPNRRKPNRIYARLPDALFEKLQQHLQSSGQTAQDFIEGLIAQFFKSTENPKE